MNRLLHGVTVAAFALATPALAQNMTSPLTSPSPPAAPAPPPPAEAAPAPAQPMAKRPVHHHHRAAAKPAMTEANQLTQQLNQDELQRTQSMGAPPSPPPPPPAPPPEPMTPPSPPMSGPRASPGR